MTDKRERILITGGSSDIGSAIAVSLSKEYDIVLSDMSISNLSSVKMKCDSSSIVDILEMKLDDLDSIEESLSGFLEKHDYVINKFVHCAGIATQIPLRMMKAAHITNSFAVNVASSALIIKTLTSKKNKKELNSAVHIASLAAIRGVSAYSVYGTTKAAILGLIRNLAIELAPKVRVNAISPGGVETSTTKDFFESRRETLEKKYPLGIGKPSNITGLVKFLLSDEAGWITGQNIVVDGGRSIDGTD